MKISNYILITVIICLFSSCDLLNLKNDNDPITGKWKIIKKSENGFYVPLDECRIKTSLEFFPDGKYTEKRFYIDSTNNCKSYEDFGEWNFFNNKYVIDNLTIIDQKRKIRLVDNGLIYSYQAWHNPLGNFTTTDIVRYYKK